MSKAIHLFGEIAKLARAAQNTTEVKDNRQVAVEIKFAAESALQVEKDVHNDRKKKRHVQ